MKKTLTVIGISFLIGLLVQLFRGDYKNAHNSASMMGVLIGSGIGFLLTVIIVPAIVSAIVFIIKRSFPHELFVKISYLILILLTIFMFLGQAALSMS